MRSIFFLLHEWKSESCIVEKNNLLANHKDSTVETVRGIKRGPLPGHNSAIIYYHSLSFFIFTELFSR